MSDFVGISLIMKKSVETKSPGARMRTPGLIIFVAVKAWSQ
jgi:hypothetical protein